MPRIVIVLHKPLHLVYFTILRLRKEAIGFVPTQNKTQRHMYVCMYVYACMCVYVDFCCVPGPVF
jgi:hypothetical protein